MTVQLEYINHLLQLFKNISYYAIIMLNAFSDPLELVPGIIPNVIISVVNIIAFFHDN